MVALLRLREISGGVLGLAVAGALGACLTVLAPDLRPISHHRAVHREMSDAECMGCHESESAATARLRAMEPPLRAQAVAQMERGEGSPLVADWMLDDTRGCLGCHTLRRVR